MLNSTTSYIPCQQLEFLDLSNVHFGTPDTLDTILQRTKRLKVGQTNKKRLTCARIFISRLF